MQPQFSTEKGPNKRERSEEWKYENRQDKNSRAGWALNLPATYKLARTPGTTIGVTGKAVFSCKT